MVEKLKWMNRRVASLPASVVKAASETIWTGQIPGCLKCFKMITTGLSDNANHDRIKLEMQEFCMVGGSLVPRLFVGGEKVWC